MGLFQLNYYEKIFPLNPRSYIFILELRHEELIQTLGPENEALIEYESILTAFAIYNPPVGGYPGQPD